MTRLLQDYVSRQARSRPAAPAVVFQGETITYGQLEESSNQLARLLKAGGSRRGDRVCFAVPKSPTAVVSILGILKADAIYVPLDLAGPPARIKKILESCRPRWLLASPSAAELLEEVFSHEALAAEIRLGWLDGPKGEERRLRADFVHQDLQAFSHRPPEFQNQPDDPAYILFTSGSTGTPKGVVITHANVIHFVEWATTYFGMGAADRISSHPPLHFDLSALDLFGTFAAGAELHLVPPELNLLPHKLAEFIRASELTQWFSVPSILTYMAKFDVVQRNDFPALKRLLWCGEVFSTPAMIYWMERLPHVRFTNLYGPTEATIASSYYTVPACPADDKAAIPIGTACPGEELLVLDDTLQPVPTGEVGDLFIGGVGLSPGYWNNPEATAAAFLCNPRGSGRLYRTGDLARREEDGLIYFVGRADSQIKSRGYRIELGEIEAALNALDFLRESAVVALSTNGFEGATLCCAYAPAPGAEVFPARLRTELSRRVPPYMLPTRWLNLPELPRNPNGKIDRRKLKEQFQSHEATAH